MVCEDVWCCVRKCDGVWDIRWRAVVCTAARCCVSRLVRVAWGASGGGEQIFFSCVVLCFPCRDGKERAGGRCGRQRRHGVDDHGGRAASCGRTGGGRFCRREGSIVPHRTLTPYSHIILCYAVLCHVMFHLAVHRLIVLFLNVVFLATAIHVPTGEVRARHARNRGRAGERVQGA